MSGVYAKRFNPFRFAKDVLDTLPLARLPEAALLGMSKAFAYLSIPLLWLLPASAETAEVAAPHEVRRADSAPSKRRASCRLTWFDALSPDYDSRHTEEEVIGWFERCGFSEVRAIEEPKVGVRGVAPARSRPRRG